MSIQTSAETYALSVGSSSNSVSVPFVANRAPTIYDVSYPVGKRWINPVLNSEYTLCSFTSSSGTLIANWVAIGAAAGDVQTLTGDNGGPVVPTTGNINILGTSNQIGTLGASPTLTLFLSSALIAPGSIASTTSLSAGTTLTSAGATTLATTGASVNTFGNTTGATSISQLVGTGGWSVDGVGASSYSIGVSATSGTIQIGGSGANTGMISIAPGSGAQTVSIASAGGVKTVGIGSSVAGSSVNIGSNLIIASGGRQLQVKGGAVTDFIGTATLVSGTVTVANTNIAAGDHIHIQRIAANGSTTLGETSYTISAGASFTITSLILGTPASPQTADVSTVAYFIVRQV